MNASEIKLHMSARLVRERGAAKIAQDSKVTMQDLEALGVGFQAMDAALVGPAGVNGFIPAEALQTWLPGTIRAMTAPIDIDLVAGITTAGNWYDDELIIRTEEDFGKAELYGDHSNIPLASVNPGFEKRQVVRFEQGFQVGKLEDARMGAAGFQMAEGKRRAASKALDVSRNAIGWNGLAGTTTYGLLNDPNLSGVQGLGNAWLGASFDQLVAEFTAMRTGLETQMGVSLRDDNQFKLALPTGYRGVFNVYNAGGNLSFGQWLNDNYPNVTVEYTPAFIQGIGGVDVAYLIAENVDGLDDSDIGSATITQLVPARYNVLGSENGIKGYIEDAVNATAGILVLRPWAVVRREVSA